MNSKRAVLHAAIVAVLVGSAAADDDASNGQGGTEVRDHIIVACLLPPRVRKLGTMVYPERRRLTQTTAKKCELRGGEYTTYDRSQPDSAAAFFLPLAKAGDPEAQVNLGEVYEFLFETPKYPEAAVWYQKAADQNNAEATRRLAHLYEMGLGVNKDPVLAMNLWRKATGTTEGLVLASTLEQVKTASDQRIAELTNELRARNTEIESLGRDLASSKDDLAKRKAALAASEKSIAELQQALASADKKQDTESQESSRVAELESEIAKRQRTIDEQRFEIQSKQIALDAQNAQLENRLRQAALDNDRLKKELNGVVAKSNADLEQSMSLLKTRNDEIATLKNQQAQLKQQLAQQHQQFNAVAGDLEAAQKTVDTSSAAQARVKELETERQRQAAALAASESKANALTERLAAAESAATNLKTALDNATHEREHMEAQIATTEAALLSTQQQLTATEANLKVLQSQLVQAREQRDAAAQASQRVAANSEQATQLRKEIAKKDDDIAQMRARIKTMTTQRTELTAENERLREQHSQQVATRSIIDPLPDTSSLRLPKGVELGNFYAIVIGNNNYQNLRPLNFAQSDARKVNDVLTTRYGFRSELLLDATAGQMYQKFEELSDKLTAADSLVVYYAGHGVEQDRVSYWLGVDAPSTQSRLSVFGVSTDDLNRWLKKVPAKHVLVVADSCYAGAGIESTGGIKFNAQDVRQQLQFSLEERSRTVISSGRDEPVPDGGAGTGSVFTKAFVALLNENRGFLIDGEMFAYLKDRVRYRNDALIGVPTPVYARILSADHVAGQFVFVHPSVRT